MQHKLNVTIAVLSIQWHFITLSILKSVIKMKMEHKLYVTPYTDCKTVYTFYWVPLCMVMWMPSAPCLDKMVAIQLFTWVIKVDFWLVWGWFCFITWCISYQISLTHYTQMHLWNFCPLTPIVAKYAHTASAIYCMVLKLELELLHASGSQTKHS